MPAHGWSAVGLLGDGAVEPLAGIPPRRSRTWLSIGALLPLSLVVARVIASHPAVSLRGDQRIAASPKSTGFDGLGTSTINGLRIEADLFRRVRTVESSQPYQGITEL